MLQSFPDTQAKTGASQNQPLHSIQITMGHSARVNMNLTRESETIMKYENKSERGRGADGWQAVSERKRV